MYVSFRVCERRGDDDVWKRNAGFSGTFQSFFLTIDCDYSSELQTGSIASSRLSYSCVSVLFSALKEVSETSVTAKPQSHFLKICFYLQYTLGFKSLWALVKMHVFRSLLEDYWQQHWSYKDKAWWSCNVTRLSVSLQNKNLKKHQKHNYVHQALIKLQIILTLSMIIRLSSIKPIPPPSS